MYNGLYHSKVETLPLGVISHIVILLKERLVRHMCEMVHICCFTSCYFIGLCGVDKHSYWTLNCVIVDLPCCSLRHSNMYRY